MTETIIDRNTSVKRVAGLVYDVRVGAQQLRIIDLDREAIERGRSMTDAQRLLSGAELFDAACMMSEAGIRSDHPDYTDEQVLEELRRRIRIGQELRSRPYDRD
jgi:hypothetical protein